MQEDTDNYTHHFVEVHFDTANTASAYTIT